MSLDLKAVRGFSKWQWAEDVAFRDTRSPCANPRPANVRARKMPRTERRIQQTEQSATLCAVVLSPSPPLPPLPPSNWCPQSRVSPHLPHLNFTNPIYCYLYPWLLLSLLLLLLLLWLGLLSLRAILKFFLFPWFLNIFFFKNWALVLGHKRH